MIVSSAAVVVRPKSSAAVPSPTFATANVPTPVVRSVSFSRLPSAPIAADSFVGDGRVDRVQHVVQRCRAAQDRRRASTHP